VPRGHAQCVPKWRITLTFAQFRAVSATICKALPVPATSPTVGIERFGGDSTGLTFDHAGERTVTDGGAVIGQVALPAGEPALA